MWSARVACMMERLGIDIFADDLPAAWSDLQLTGSPSEASTPSFCLSHLSYRVIAEKKTVKALCRIGRVFGS